MAGNYFGFPPAVPQYPPGMFGAAPPPQFNYGATPVYPGYNPPPPPYVYPAAAQTFNAYPYAAGSTSGYFAPAPPAAPQPNSSLPSTFSSLKSLVATKTFVPASKFDSTPSASFPPVTTYSAAPRSSSNLAVSSGPISYAGSQAVMSGVAAGRTFGNKNRLGLGATPNPPHRRNGNAAGGGNQRNPQELIYCDVCKISCAGPHTYKEHVEGQKHKKRAAMTKDQLSQTLPKDKPAYRCDMCNVVCSSADGFASHVRGAKHQRTLKLHTALGKPTPTEPTVIPPKIGSGPSVKYPGKNPVERVVVPPVASKPDGDGVDLNEDAPMEFIDKEIQPVGEDYIENVCNEQGKLKSFFCKLCECSFSDLLAKDMHLKGRRHRHQYKKKVDPSLEVDPPKSVADRKMGRKMDRSREFRHPTGRFPARNPFSRPFGLDFPITPIGPPVPLFQFGPPPSSHQNSLEIGCSPPRFDLEMDRYVMAKHSTIYPTEEELAAVQKIVTNMEKGLKEVSDCFADQEKVVAEARQKVATEKIVKAEVLPTAENVTTIPSILDERLLKGVMRVGVLAKGLMLRGDIRIQLVVLCSEKPTRSLLKRVHDLLRKYFETHCVDEKYLLNMAPEQSSLNVASNVGVKANIQIVFTSPLLREGGEEATATASVKADPIDVLNKPKCLEALALLRHAKWFQVGWGLETYVKVTEGTTPQPHAYLTVARCSGLPACMIALRILRDLCQRVPTWTPLSTWALELLVEKAVYSSFMPLSPGEVFRRVFELISAGLLMSDGPGLLDPCEKDPTDALADMSNQQREDVTASAQHALRLIAFRQIHKVLGMDLLLKEDPSVTPVKRLRETDELEKQDRDVKREKLAEDVEMKPITSGSPIANASESGGEMQLV